MTTGARVKAIKVAFKKPQLMAEIATLTQLPKKEVALMFEALAEVIHGHMRKGGAGEFTMPGLLKCKIQRKPATKARKGINPFNGEEITFKAKPARNTVTIRPLKKLKEMAE